MIEIQELRRRDYKKARQFAVQGMHLYWYVSDRTSLNLYARYFWDTELSSATRAYGAYVDDKFVGVLLADMKGEPKRYRSIWRSAYIRFFDWLQRRAAGTGLAPEPHIIKGVQIYGKIPYRLPNREIELQRDHAVEARYYFSRGIFRLAEDFETKRDMMLTALWSASCLSLASEITNYAGGGIS